MDGQRFTVRQLPPDWCVPIPLGIHELWNPLTEISPTEPIRVVTYYMTSLVTSEGYVLYLSADLRADLDASIAREIRDLNTISRQDPFAFPWATSATMSGKKPYPLDDLISKIDEVTGDDDATE